MRLRVDPPSIPFKPYTSRNESDDRTTASGQTFALLDCRIVPPQTDPCANNERLIRENYTRLLRTYSALLRTYEGSA